jgi:hypothetical protein
MSDETPKGAHGAAVLLKSTDVSDRHHLDAMTAAGCQNPSCKTPLHELVLRGRCHPGAGTNASYKQGSGVLTIACRVCDRVVLQVLVGSRS